MWGKEQCPSGWRMQHGEVWAALPGPRHPCASWVDGRQGQGKMPRRRVAAASTGSGARAVRWECEIVRELGATFKR